MTTESNLDETLRDRGNKYGSFRGNASTTQGMYAIALTGENTRALTSCHKEAIHMILHKISRIMNGDPDHVDSWLDIAGYAQIMIKEIEIRAKPKRIDTSKIGPNGETT